jgi:alanine dehydrogenase
MRVGIPKEVKDGEHRVGLTPAAVQELKARGHQVVVERDCGAAIGFSNEAYINAGADVLATAMDIYQSSQLIVKVKEPQPQEYPLLRPGQLLFTYLHLAADKQLADALRLSGAICIAYETVTDNAGRLPLLAPMSEVAGRIAVQAGAHHLEIAQGGRGVLLGGVPGVAPANVLVLGGGVVGTQSARVALGMGAKVTVLDKSLPRLRELDQLFMGQLHGEFMTQARLEELALEADLIIGAVLVAGASAPKLLTRARIAQLQQGSVLVDVAIDQGGCFETSRPTTHQQPTYVVDGVVHYCVANIPSAVARTATMALTNSTLPFVMALAEGGVGAALADHHLSAGINVYGGEITHRAVAESLGYQWVDARTVAQK